MPLQVLQQGVKGHGALFELYNTDGDSADLRLYQNQAKVHVTGLKIRWLEIFFSPLLS